MPNRQSKPEAHTGNLRQDRPMEIGTGSSPQSLMFKVKAIIRIVPKRGKPLRGKDRQLDEKKDNRYCRLATGRLKEKPTV